METLFKLLILLEKHMVSKPIDQIEKELLKKIPNKYLKNIPTKWERVGDVLIIKLSRELNEYREKLGKTYADVLNCKSVLNDKGGITGELRKPDVEHIYGSKNTETVHIENRVRFKTDPAKLMFSSGNMDERIFMSKLNTKNEIIVDMFAGIGYFSIPIAVHCKPKKIFACEKNPEAYNYLCQNVLLNHVSKIVEPIKGDNREIASENIADRVVMGYIGGTEKFLDKGIKCLKNNRGIIHFHGKYPEKIKLDFPLKIFEDKAKKYNRKVRLIDVREVKSYAPGISHFVFDCEIK